MLFSSDNVTVEIFFISYTVAEPLYGLGFPRRRYAPRTFNCSEYNYGLGNCRYTSAIDPECNNGAHVAGVRCTESKPNFIFLLQTAQVCTLIPRLQRRCDKTSKFDLHIRQWAEYLSRASGCLH